MAAGVSSRMKKALEIGSETIDPKLIEEANTLPKCMLSVWPKGQRFIDYILYNAVQGGFHEIIIVLHPADTVTETHIRSEVLTRGYDLTLQIVRQIVPAERSKPWGTGDAVYQALQASDLKNTEWYSVSNADNLCSKEAFRKAYETTANTIFPYETRALGIPDDVRSKYGLVLSDRSSGAMIRMVEKPTAEEILILEQEAELSVNMNLYTLRFGDTYEYLSTLIPHPVRDEKEFNDVVNHLASFGGMRSYIIRERLPDLTSKVDISLVQILLTDLYPHL